jgi:hypothetical protein
MFKKFKIIEDIKELIQVEDFLDFLFILMLFAGIIFIINKFFEVL